MQIDNPRPLALNGRFKINGSATIRDPGGAIVQANILYVASEIPVCQKSGILGPVDCLSDGPGQVAPGRTTQTFRIQIPDPYHPLGHYPHRICVNIGMVEDPVSEGADYTQALQACGNFRVVNEQQSIAVQYRGPDTCDTHRGCHFQFRLFNISSEAVSKRYTFNHTTELLIDGEVTSTAFKLLASNSLCPEKTTSVFQCSAVVEMAANRTPGYILDYSFSPLLRHDQLKLAGVNAGRTMEVRHCLTLLGGRTACKTARVLAPSNPESINDSTRMPVGGTGGDLEIVKGMNTGAYAFGDAQGFAIRLVNKSTQNSYKLRIEDRLWRFDSGIEVPYATGDPNEGGGSLADVCPYARRLPWRCDHVPIAAVDPASGNSSRSRVLRMRVIYDHSHGELRYSNYERIPLKNCVIVTVLEKNGEPNVPTPPPSMHCVYYDIAANSYSASSTDDVLPIPDGGLQWNPSDFSNSGPAPIAANEGELVEQSAEIDAATVISQNKDTGENAGPAADTNYRITKTGPSECIAGQDCTYQITITKLQDSPAEDLIFTDDAWFDDDSAWFTGINNHFCTGQAPQLSQISPFSCVVATSRLSAGQSVSFDLTMQYSGLGQTEGQNCAFLSRRNPTHFEEVSRACVAVTSAPAQTASDTSANSHDKNNEDPQPAPNPDDAYRITKTGPVSCTPGEDCLFSVTVTKVSDAPAEDLIFTDDVSVDDNALFITGLRNNQCTGLQPPFPQISPFQCTLATSRLGKDQSLSFNVMIRALESMAGREGENCAIIARDDPTHNAEVGRSCIPFSVLAGVSHADLEISKTLTDGQPCLRSQDGSAVCDFTVTLRNPGPWAFDGDLVISDEAQIARASDQGHLSDARTSGPQLECLTYGSPTYCYARDLQLAQGQELSFSVRYTLPSHVNQFTRFNNCARLYDRLNLTRYVKEVCRPVDMPAQRKSNERTAVVIQKTGPTVCRLDERCLFQVTITNTGNTPLDDLIFTDELTIDDDLGRISGITGTLCTGVTPQFPQQTPFSCLASTSRLAPGQSMTATLDMNYSGLGKDAAQNCAILTTRSGEEVARSCASFEYHGAENPSCDQGNTDEPSSGTTLPGIACIQGINCPDDTGGNPLSQPIPQQSGNSSNQPGEGSIATQCQPGQRYDRNLKQCISLCSTGQIWDPKTNSCSLKPITTNPIKCLGGELRGNICWCGIGRWPYPVAGQQWTFQCRAVQKQTPVPDQSVKDENDDIICTNGNIRDGKCRCPKDRVRERTGTTAWQCVPRSSGNTSFSVPKPGPSVPKPAGVAKNNECRGGQWRGPICWCGIGKFPRPLQGARNSWICR